MYPTKKVQKYLNDFEQESDAKRKFSYWLAAFSVKVWETLDDLHNLEKGSRCSETTITEDFVMGLLRVIKKDKNPIPIRIFHSKNEKTNGSDIEIVLEIDNDEYIIFPCQAKKLYVQSGNNSIPKYEAFNHKKGEQKKKLIAYAEKIKGFPLYLLYNYSKTLKEKEKELYGCTLISAIHLVESKFPQMPTFCELHPPAQPLKTIMDITTLATLNKKYGQISGHSAEPYTKSEIENKKLWHELGTPYQDRFSSRVDVSKFLRGNLIEYQLSEEFSPTFRILITANSIDLNTRTINYNL